jgi:phospholipid/cholesterol/gamma-HCH transport system permease protein
MNGAVGAALEPVRGAVDTVGRATLLAWGILRVLPRPSRYLTAALDQAYLMGVRSLPLVMVMAFLGGAVASQQTGAQFTGSMPPWVIGSVVTAGVLTELGPLLTAMVLVGRVGASVAAELASMKVTEQIDALRAMGRDPVAHLVVPRVLAGILVLPPLVIVANAVGMLSGWATGILTIDGLTTGDFLFGVRYYFRPFALIYSVLKGAAFGLTITFLACFVGLGGGGGAEGVGRTTTAAVVATTLAIMIIDVLMIPLLKAF